MFCVFDVNDNIALAQFFKYNSCMIIKWSSESLPWTAYYPAPPAVQFRCCSAGVTLFSNYNFIKSEKTLAIPWVTISVTYFISIFLSLFLIWSLPNVFFFIQYSPLLSLCFLLCLAKKKNPNNNPKKPTTFILFSDLIPVCSFCIFFSFSLLLPF